MKSLLIALTLFSTSAFAQGYGTGLPMPGLPKSVGPKPSSGSTSVTFATDQIAITVNATSAGLPTSLGPKPMSGSTSVTFATDQTPITVNSNSYGKVPFTSVRQDYSTNNVTVFTYSTLVASTSAPTTALDIFDSSGSTLAIAYGAPGSEVNKFFVYPGGNGVIPVAIPMSTRVSIIAISPSATSGELDINFYD